MLVAAAVIPIYATQVSPLYDYMGYHYYGVTAVGILISIAFVLAPLVFLPQQVRRPSDLGLWILFLGSYVPSCFIPPLAFPAGSRAIWMTPLVVGLGLGTVRLILRIKLPLTRLPQVIMRRVLFSFFFLLVTAALLFVLLITLQFNLDLDIATHYDRRFEARELTAARPLLGYVAEWLGYFVVPLLAALAVRGRSWLLATAAVFSVLVLFAFDGTKGALIMLVAGAAVAWGAARPKWLQPRRLLLLLLGLLLVALAEPWIFGSMAFTDYFVRRIAVIPGFLAACYVDFFSTHALMMMSDVSGFRAFSPNPYGVSTAFVIGEQYLATPGLNANGGVWPSAFAELHLPGVVLFSVLVGASFAFFDRLWQQRGDSLLFVSAAISALIWIEIPFPSSLSSAGVIFWFVLPLVGASPIRRAAKKFVAPSPTRGG